MGDNSTVVNNRRGRPSGNPGTRAALVKMASEHFLAHGYTGTSVRALAREAGVDHSLVNYYFGSKRGLFAEVMGLTLPPSRILDVILARSGPRMAEAVLTGLLTVWDDPNHRAPMVAMIGEATTSPVVRSAVCGYLENEVFARVAHLAGGQNTTERTAAASAILSGVVFARYILHLEPLASMTPDRVVRILAPALRAALTPP
jgi:AcrR family transcriptional regulator